MTKEEVKKRIERLKEMINYHRYLYHVLNREEVSQAVLDSLKHELYKLEEEHPEFITADSPTQRIAGKPLDEFKKVKHEVPMLSIEDIFLEKELQDWEDYLKRLIPSVVDEVKASSPPSPRCARGSVFEYFCEYKVDGFAITLIYESGIFIVGATRGNGITGEDVTQNLKTIESIPLKLDYNPPAALPSKTWAPIEENLKKLIEKEKIEIRGEVYMEKRAFERFNEEQRKKGLPVFANPRNLAAGSIRQLDPKLAASRPLKFLAYDIVTDIGQKRHSEEHQVLTILGFKTDEGRVCKNLSDIIDFWREVAKKRETLPFQIDGVVININDNSFFKKLGIVGKSPRGIRAFKFSPKQATTKVLDIKIQVGRTGAITPVAVLEPVEVGGVTITRATLHNEEEIKRLGAKIGDTVIVERAGDVIPAVAKVITELRSGVEKEFDFPKVCPVCKTNLIRPLGEVVWRCPNKKCPARKKENLYYFTSKKAFNIEGLGPKIIDQLVNEDLISQAADIFQLKEGDLLPLDRFGEKSAKNLIEAIQKSKKIPLARFIFALGIRHVGEETAEKLANYLSNVSEDENEIKFHRLGIIDKLKRTSKEELKKVPDIGEKVSENIHNWFQLEENQKFIRELLKAEVEIIKSEKVEKKLGSKTFVLTGSLETMTRETAKEKVRLLGGEISESVSQKTDYLIVGKEPGSKLVIAKKLGIKIISEREFLEMIK